MFVPLWCLATVGWADDSNDIDFGRDVRPILSDHCFACHGPDQAAREAGLRLDLATVVGNAGEGGDAEVEVPVIPGDPDGSPLIARVESNDPYEVMPPPEAHKPLSAEQKDILRRWVASGAEYEMHWSLIAPRRHEVPAGGGSADDPIDRFINRKLLESKLQPNPPADRPELLRRVTFDLTGLPPTVEEIKRFSEDTSPDAYEKVVDRLLESPRFGEHVGRYWLDLVRYGDTHGLHLDNYREMWPYRDWVIESFNANKPFDQFITEQLAGDLLPGDELSNQIASGFNRLNVTTNEGGSIYEEVFARNVIDRTDAFGSVFLGLTVGCAVCHDHKFDPISQRDFYALSAFFNSLDGQEMDGNVKDHPPVVRVPTPESDQQLEQVRQMRSDLQAEMNGPLPEVDAAEARWTQVISGGTEETQPTWIPLHPNVATSTAETSLEIADDGQVRASGTVPDKETVTIEAPLPAGSDFQLVRLEVLTDKPDDLPGRSSNGNAVLSEFEVAIKSTATGDEFLPLGLAYAEADYEQADGPKFKVGFAIDGKVEPDAGWAVGGHQKPGPRTAWFVTEGLMDGQSGSATIRLTLKYESQYSGHSFTNVRFSVSADLPRVSADRQLEIGPWSLVGPFEVESPQPGYYQDFASQKREFDSSEVFHYRDQDLTWHPVDDYLPAAVNQLPTIEDRSSVTLLHRRITAPTAQSVTLLLGTEDGYQVWMGGKKIAEVQANRTIAPLAEEIPLALEAGKNDLYLKVVHHEGGSAFATALRSPAAPIPDQIVRLASMPPDQRTAEQRSALRHYYRRVITFHPEWLTLRDMASGLRKREQEIRDALPTTLVWKETETPREAHVLLRGEYDKPGDTVNRDVPAALPPLPENAARDRLGLARWLTSPDHPLTARVAVNRFWQQLFGTGLVKTSEDFGAQGAPPSHPQLLDTIAVDFREGGWDVKALFKRLVMTDAYRRSQFASPESLARDPNNRLLARGPRFRLDAEMIRDASLFSSGLLVEKMGGPSVKPPQPAGLWRAVGYTSSNTAVFQADEGDKIYRRSVYTFWKRTSAPPQMTTFDAPSRESCTARRERTNTPLQALLLLNDPQRMAAAENLYQRSIDIGDAVRPDRVRWMFQAVVSRPPSEYETDELVALWNDLEQFYADSPEQYERLGVASAAAAAGTMVASTIFNLDEAINK
jgi:hypothetical protein